jgi:hypothetical protein
MTLLKRLEKSRHGQKAEVRASKRLGGRLQPGSGCKDHSKGDFFTPDFLFESKSTISESLSLKLEWLRKISKEAADITKEPALTIQFVDGSGRPVLDGAWVMVPERVFKEIIGG